MANPDDAEKRREMHRANARKYLDEAQQTTDLNRRQELLDLCVQELEAAEGVSKLH